MLFLVLAVVLNVYLAVIFKIFPRFKIDSLQAIVYNYWVCVITGSIFLGHFPISAESIEEPWFPFSLGMGAMFISIFNLMAFSTKVDGVTPTTIANKLSLVIPVLFALWLYNEPMTTWKLCGLIIAVPAIWLSASNGGKEEDKKKKAWIWLVLLFIGSGLLDTFVNYVTHLFFKDDSDQTQLTQAAYLVHCFAAAGTIGIIIVAGLLISGKRKFEWKHLIAGVLVGIPNYFSIYFLIKFLNSGFMQSSAAIPVVNIGVMLLATMSAIFIFGESKNWKRLLGILLSVTAILLIAFSGKG